MIDFEEPWDVVAERQECDDEHGHSAVFAGAPGSRTQRMADGDVALDGDGDRQIDGTGLRRRRQHECVRSDYRMDVANVEAFVVVGKRIERWHHEEQDRRQQQHRVHTCQTFSIHFQTVGQIITAFVSFLFGILMTKQHRRFNKRAYVSFTWIICLQQVN